MKTMTFSIRTRMRIIALLMAVPAMPLWAETSAQEADSLTVTDRVVRTMASSTDFRGEVWANPALYYHYTSYSWTTLDVNGFYHDKGRASLRQEGDRDTRIGVDVRSFIHLSQRSRVFGRAGYRSEKQENVLWNENLDWQLVAPYVTGDSIGGFLKGETYYFEGGYAGLSGRWTWGVAGGYRASHNYRDKDPRPRNTASDLTLSAGAGYLLGRYRLGLSADFRLYQQNCDISFLADKGSTSVYHMLGLGMDYVRFAGTQTATKYQGTQWGGSIGLLPVEADQGISVVVALSHLSLDKKLTGANNLTLLNLGTTTLQGNVAWMQKRRSSEHLAVKLEGHYTQRKGTENLYGEAGGSSYGTLIGTSPGIRIHRLRTGIRGLWELLPTDRQTWGGAILPHVLFHQMEADYKAVSRSVRLSALEAMVCARLQYRKHKLHLLAEAHGGYYAHLSTEQSLSGLDTSKSSAQTLLANVAYLSSDYGTVGVRIRGDYPIFKHYNLSLSVQWQMARYRDVGTTRYAACSLGIFF